MIFAITTIITLTVYLLSKNTKLDAATCIICFSLAILCDYLFMGPQTWRKKRLQFKKEKLQFKELKKEHEAKAQESSEKRGMLTLLNNDK